MKVFALKIVRNFIFLSFAELISKILSLVTFAYLARVLSPNGFGIIGFSSAFVSYFILIVNFGFDAYGIRIVAKDQTSSPKLVNTVISSRLIISLPLFIVLLGCVVPLNKDYTTKVALIISGLNLFTAAISIDWFFQGIQKMSYIAKRQIISSCMILFFVVVLVRNTSDVLIAIAVTSISLLLNSSWLLRTYYKSFGKIIIGIDTMLLKELLKGTAPIAVSTFMIGIYYNLDLLMIGFMKDDHDIGIYNAAIKIMMAAALFNTFMKSIYPEIAKRWEENKTDFNSYMQNMIQIVWTFTFSFVTLTLFSKDFVSVLYGPQYSEAFLPTGILLVNQCVIWFFSPFAFPLLAINQQRHFLRAILFGAVANIILNIILIPKYSYNGAAIATLISEVIVGINQMMVFVKITGVALLRFSKIPMIFLFVELAVVTSSQYFIKNLILSLGLAGVTFFVLVKKYNIISYIKLL